MKFLCVDCDAQMASVDRASPHDGTLAIVFRCPSCAREVAMLANPMETQMVNSLCVHLGESEVAQQPFEAVRSQMKTGGDDRLEDVAAAGPSWSDEAEARLVRVPGFVRGMVRRLYNDWADERGITEITLATMDEARSELGLDEV